MIIHPIPPFFDDGSTILILGSFPSVRSRESLFFYGHPQNRFWRVLSAVMDEPCPGTIEEKRSFLHRNHIALWDVIHSCDITGSSDSSIKNVVPNELSMILDSAPIRAIFTNGRKADALYRQYAPSPLSDGPPLSNSATCLPSTSPANARWDIDRLIQAWSVIKEA